MDDRVPEHRDSLASSSHGSSLERLREVRIWVNTMLIFTSLNNEIARSARGPTLQVPHAEDAMAKPYFEL